MVPLLLGCSLGEAFRSRQRLSYIGNIIVAYPTANKMYSLSIFSLVAAISQAGQVHVYTALQSHGEKSILKKAATYTPKI